MYTLLKLICIVIVLNALPDCRDKPANAAETNVVKPGTPSETSLSERGVIIIGGINDKSVSISWGKVVKVSGSIITVQNKDGKFITYQLMRVTKELNMGDIVSIKNGVVKRIAIN